jgi:acetylornithine deacetylase
MTSDPTLELLRDLVAIDSVNPSLVPGAAGEGAVADVIARDMRSSGLDVEVWEVRPGRPNVVGVLEGKSPGRTLMLCGHMDTVGVEGMRRPFDPVERDGRLYGRGAQDMKSGVAAMLGAAQALAGSLPRGRVIVAAVADEEHTSIGAGALVERWTADGAIVTEPTDLQIGIGHKGFSWIEIETRGRAAHGSRPDEGRDAILRMGRVLARLEQLDRELQARPPHAIMGAGSLHTSIVSGGRELSSYPDRCVLQMERRTIAGEPAELALEEVQAVLADLRRQDPEFEGSARMRFSQPPHELPRDHELTRLLAAAVREIGREPAIGGMTFWTDAALLGRAGIPSLLFGPAGAGLHGVEEYVELESVLACRDVLVELTRAFC